MAQKRRISRISSCTLSAILFALCFSNGALAKTETRIWMDKSASKFEAVKIPSLAPIVRQVASAVLAIYTKGEIESQKLPQGHPPLSGDMPKERFHLEGEGSGFVIHPDGYALTNYHVIENAKEIRVKLGKDREQIRAQVVGIDPLTDVALLKLPDRKEKWPYIPLGQSDQLEVGDFVIAIGNPFGLIQSVSLGVLSARGRKSIMPSRRLGLYDFLQTDASINPGNSGGPLLNLKGEVIGMNTANNVVAQGIGFAIPIEMVKHILPSLQREGRVARAWLGVSIQGIPLDLSRAMGLKDAHGALVRMVLKDGPAARAGVQPGDMITTFDGEKVLDASDLPLMAGAAEVGRHVKLGLIRDGKEMQISLELGAHPKNLPPMNQQSVEIGDQVSTVPISTGKSFGITIMDLNIDSRRRLGLADGQSGILLYEVKENSVAAKAGLFADDIVVKINGSPVTGIDGFRETLTELNSGDAVRLLIRRGGKMLFIGFLAP
jgi:serine protease Do